MLIKAGRIWLTTWKTCSRISENNIKLFLVKYLFWRPLSQTTEGRKVEARKPLMFQDTVFEFSLDKATLRQRCHAPWGHHDSCTWVLQDGNLQGSQLTRVRNGGQPTHRKSLCLGNTGVLSAL